MHILQRPFLSMDIMKEVNSGYNCKGNAACNMYFCMQTYYLRLVFFYKFVTKSKIGSCRQELIRHFGKINLKISVQTP